MRTRSLPFNLVDIYYTYMSGKSIIKPANLNNHKPQPRASTDTMATKAISDIESRINQLEKRSWSTCSVKNGNDKIETITPEARRARRHVQSSHCYSSKWVWCPGNYYELKLEERKSILGA